jgi:general secretion pathway protein C
MAKFSLKDWLASLRGVQQKLKNPEAWAQLRLRVNRVRSTLGEQIVHAFERTPSVTEMIGKLPNGLYPALALLGLISADTVMQGAGAYLMSTAPVTRPARRVIPADPYLGTLQSYGSIASRNIFCPGCEIPELLRVKVEKPKNCSEAERMRDTSVNLIGTIVLSDPRFSVATIQRGSSDTQAVQMGDQINGLGEVFEIRQRRVCFVPSDGSRVEYIELPEEESKFGQPVASARPEPVNDDSGVATSIPGIDKTSENDFQVSRNTLNKYINDPNVLFQAHAVPNRVDGAIEGFKILSIQPGSVYEALGVQVGDIVKSVNGEPMNSLAKAQELFMALRSSSDVNITVNRGGADVNQNYKIK